MPQRVIPPTGQDERQQADTNCAPLFRPIAPKPRPNPEARVHSVQTVLPTPVIVPRAPVDADGFVSFGGFERYISHGNYGGGVPRSEYANTIVSYQNLHVSGETTLRLYQVVPKSRTSLIDPHANVSLSHFFHRLVRSHSNFASSFIYSKLSL